MSRMYFSSVPNKVRDFFLKENIKLPRYFLNNLLTFMPRVCSYEEEESKIKPSLTISTNMDEAVKQAPGTFRLKISKGKKNGNDIEKKLKPLIPFCNNGWHVYINISPKYMEYGLMRAFTGLKGLSVTETLFTSEESIKQSLGFKLIELTALNNFEIKMRGLLGNELIIDSRFVDTSPNRDSFLEMSEDISSGIEDDTTRETVNKVFYNLLKVLTQKVHGTICMIVKSGYKFPNAHLSDGIWLEEPIDLSQYSLNHIQNPGDISAEMFYALSGVFIEMLNHDGITIVDNKGCVRGYNMFISKENLKADEISGGSRKRAAYTLSQLSDPNVIGVYFQSQDGNSFYNRG